MHSQTLGPGAAEIVGLDLSRPLDPSPLLAAFAQFPVLVFRNQRLTPTQFASFARHFGTLETYEAPEPGSSPPLALRETDARTTPDQRLYVCPEDAAVLLMTNETLLDATPLALIDNAEIWHADGSHRPAPYDAVALHVVRNPAQGGETDFCDLRALYDALPEGIRTGLLGAVASHHWSKSRNPLFAAKLTPEARAQGERLAAAIPEIRHPVVCRSDRDGRPHLFLSPRFALRIEGLAPDLSRAILDDLFALMDDPAIRYRHVWRDGDAVIWDNRRANHCVRAYAADDARSRYRITVSARAPLSAFQATRDAPISSD